MREYIVPPPAAYLTSILNINIFADVYRLSGGVTNNDPKIFLKFFLKDQNFA